MAVQCQPVGGPKPTTSQEVVLPVAGALRWGPTAWPAAPGLTAWLAGLSAPSASAGCMAGWQVPPCRPAAPSAALARSLVAPAETSHPALDARLALALTRTNPCTRHPPHPAGKTPAEINDPAFSAQLNAALGEVVGQCGEYISSTAAAAARRRALLQGGVTITSTVAAADPAVSWLACRARSSRARASRRPLLAAALETRGP